jgi:hypothetical protein
MIGNTVQPQITAIASRFQLFECIECATAIRQFLVKQGISGSQVTLFTGSVKNPLCNIYHERLQQNISVNGRHTAIAVEIAGQELMFDNLNPEGISKVNWMRDFYCPIQDFGGNFQITETAF